MKAWPLRFESKDLPWKNSTGFTRKLLEDCSIYRLISYSISKSAACNSLINTGKYVYLLNLKNEQIKEP